MHNTTTQSTISPGQSRDSLADLTSFTPKEWYLKTHHMVNQKRLTQYDVNILRRLVGTNEKISEKSLRNFYYPLAEVIHRQIIAYFKTRPSNDMFIIGISGSVAVGKSTGARVLTELLKKKNHQIAMITTDHFLLDQPTLAERQIERRKGFPESYNEVAITQFLADLKHKASILSIPTYDHVAYTILPHITQEFQRPQILILEGINVLQRQDFPLDFAIYFDAPVDIIEQWYVERFLSFRDNAFQQPGAYFERYASLSDAQARATAQELWREINLINLQNHIQPSQSRADCVINKKENHLIQKISLKMPFAR